MARNRIAVLFTASLIATNQFWLYGASAPSQASPSRGIGSTIVTNELSVTLLDAKVLSLNEYRKVSGTDRPDWAGGGLHLVFLTENRPGAPMTPALGEIRVIVDSHPYNAVTNPTSSKPFAPDVIIRAVNDFFSTPYGRTLTRLEPVSRHSSVRDILEVFVRGTALADGAEVQIELEQGETHRPDTDGRLRQLTPAEMANSFTRFRFFVPSLPSRN